MYKHITWQEPAADVDQKEKFWSQSLVSASQNHPVLSAWNNKETNSWHPSTT